MNHVTSSDGTRIAFERFGEGSPVILVGGATCDRAMTRPLAEELAERLRRDQLRPQGPRRQRRHATVRGQARDRRHRRPHRRSRGQRRRCTVTPPARVLALHAAAHGLPIAGLALHEPPYAPDGEEERRISREYGENLKAIPREDRRGDAVALFHDDRSARLLEVVEGMRGEPWWAGMEAVAPTLLYDSEVMGDVSRAARSRPNCSVR